MTSDIIDRIDALVDEQLAAGEPEGGYESRAAATNPDPDYPDCPHCRRHWHGLRITERIARMHARGQFDPDYTIAADDSPVICEGSEFIGPRWVPEQFRQQVADEEAAYERREFFNVGVRPREPREIVMQIIVSQSRIRDSFREAMQRFGEWAEQLAVDPQWEITGPGQFTLHDWFGDSTAPACTAVPDIAVTFGPQNWIHEIRRIPPSLQFPRSLPSFRLVSPLEAVVRQHWPEFTAVDDHAPPRDGYDFSQYATEDEQHGPAPRRQQDRGPIQHGPPATARRRGARARG